MTRDSATDVTPVLEITSLVVRRGARTIVDGVDLHVAAGEIVALMGLSGSGKTTILRAVAGLERFDAGAIRIDRLTVDPARSGRQHASDTKVGLVFQSHCLFEHLSALDNVKLALVHVARAAHAAATERAGRLLAELGVGHRAAAWPRELSGGEAQRVAIARALAMNPSVLLLDEPTASLDPARRGDLGRTLRDLAGAGRSLLLTSHDQDFVAMFADRVAILAEGSVVEHGPAKAVLESPAHDATRELLQIERAAAR